MRRFRALFSTILTIALIMTALAALQLAYFGGSPIPTTPQQQEAASPPGKAGPTVQRDVPQSKGPLTSIAPSPIRLLVERNSLALASASWVALLGAWIWRGRVRSTWSRLGFDQDVFRLIMRMRGGSTRIRLLNSLSAPKDRLQLARDLGLDWKAVDHHVQVLHKYGLIREHSAYGNVKVYELTQTGRMLLQLLEEIGKADGSQQETSAQ